MPLKNQLHVPALLDNVSVKYKNEEYIWDKVAPIVMVKKDTDLYRVYDRNFKMPETLRAPKAVSREFSFDVSNSSYVLEKHALKDYVSPSEADNYDQESLEIDTTENLTDAIQRKLELKVANLFTTSSWSLNVSLAAAFTSNTVTTDPVPVFDTGASTVIGNSGKTPNFGIIPRDGFIAIKNHVSILDRVKYTSSEVSKAMVGALLGLSELHIPTAMRDTADEGLAASVSNMYGNICFLGWKSASAGRKQPSCAYTFMKDAPKVKSWIDDEREGSKAIEVQYEAIPKVVASLCGYLIKGSH